MSMRGEGLNKNSWRIAYARPIHFFSVKSNRYRLSHRIPTTKIKWHSDEFTLAHGCGSHGCREDPVLQLERSCSQSPYDDIEVTRRTFSSRAFCDNMLIFQGLKEIGKFHTCVPACTGRKFRRALMDLLTAGAVYTSKLFYVGGDTSRTYLSRTYLTRIVLHCGTFSSFDDLSVSTAVKPKFKR